MGVDVDAMDADAAPSQSLGFDDEEWDGTEEMRKRKLDEYMNELYGLEFNDIVRTPALFIVYFVHIEITFLKGRSRSPNTFQVCASPEIQLRSHGRGDPYSDGRRAERICQPQEVDTLS